MYIYVYIYVYIYMCNFGGGWWGLYGDNFFSRWAINFLQKPFFYYVPEMISPAGFFVYSSGTRVNMTLYEIHPLLWALFFLVIFAVHTHVHIYVNLDVDFFLPKKHFFYFFIEYRHITYHFTRIDLTKKIRNFVFGFEHVGAGRLRPGRGFESRSRPFFGHCTVVTVQWPMRKCWIFFFLIFFFLIFLTMHFLISYHN